MIVLTSETPLVCGCDEGFAAAAGRVRTGRLRDIVATIAVPRSIMEEPEANRKVGSWLYEQLAACGLETTFQGRYSNVVAMTRSCAQTGRCVLVGAHYDSKPGCPGADDNASAVAAMLVCAEIVAEQFTHLPLCFVAFNGEEDDLLGSKDFVRECLRQDRPRVLLAHILEMVGYVSTERPRAPWYLPLRVPEAGDFLALLANRRSIPDAYHVMSAGRTYVEDLPLLSLLVHYGLEVILPALKRSDHAFFWKRKIPAVLWTDTSEFRNRHYHQPTDTPETLDYEFLTRVTRLLLVSVLSSERFLVR